jgi:hypothetical protein
MILGRDIHIAINTCSVANVYHHPLPQLYLVIMESPEARLPFLGQGITCLSGFGLEQQLSWTAISRPAGFSLARALP